MKNIHVIPTSSPSKIFYIAENFHLEKGQLIEPKSYHNVYITSDEEIKEDNWGLSKLNEVILFGRSYNEKFYKKIILTTDQDLIADGVQVIDDTFLEWFVKNPNCEDVEVEIETTSIQLPQQQLSENSYDLAFRWINKKVYKIIIPQEEPKDLAYWKENAEEDYMKVPISVLRYITELEERMYSEEEVEKMVRAAYTFGEKEFKYFGAFKEWFEQFKKKQ
jgi:hypothetical protein